MYSVQFTNASLRIFKKLPEDVQEGIKKRVAKLKENPLIGNRLRGAFSKFRSLHLSYNGVSYRVIYKVFPDLNTIIIFLADKRENIYRRLEQMRI